MDPVFTLKPWHRMSPLHWDPFVFLREDTPQLMTQLLEDEAAHEWAEANGALRVELGAAVSRFRAECAPLVGPEVTVRGRVVASPRSVPVDPRARRFRRRAEAMAALRSWTAHEYATPRAAAQSLTTIADAVAEAQAVLEQVAHIGEEEEDHA